MGSFLKHDYPSLSKFFQQVYPEHIMQALNLFSKMSVVTMRYRVTMYTNTLKSLNLGTGFPRTKFSANLAPGTPNFLERRRLRYNQASKWQACLSNPKTTSS